MTLRKYLIASLAILSSAPLVAPAATSPAPASGTAATLPIADKDVVRYLNSADLAEWNANLQKITDANTELQQGKKDLAAKADPNAVFKQDLTAQHTKGTNEVKEANAILKLTNADQNKLRQAAIAKRDAIKQGAAATEAATLTVATGQWPDVYGSLCEKVLSSLWGQDYKYIYLAGVYAFEEPAYVAKPDLTEQVRQQLIKLDQGKNTFSRDQVSFKLGQEDGKLVVSYPNRAYREADNAKAALIVGEILYESHDGYAAVDLRAVDLANMHIVANQIVMLSVDPSLGKGLGLAIYKNMSKRILPTPDSADAEPAKTITVNLEDPNNVIADAKKATFAFRVGTQGHPDTLENRFAILMLKSYFRDQQADLGLSDQDFLTMVLPPDKPGDLSANPADVGGEWLLPDVASFDPSLELTPLKLHVIENNSNHDVGKVTITRDLPKLDNPTADDLRAGGYTAGPAPAPTLAP